MHFELLELEKASEIEEKYSSNEHEDFSHAYKMFNKGKRERKKRERTSNKDKKRNKEKKTTDLVLWSILRRVKHTAST